MFYAIVLGALAAASPEAAQGEAKAILAEGYQTELPRAPTEADVLQGTARAQRSSPQPSATANPSAPVTRTLLWVVIGGAAFLLLSFFLSELRGRVGTDGDDAVPAANDAGAPLSQPLGDADALAREGRFGEAIHVLLLRTLAELARRVAVPTSLTSREILVQAQLPGQAREALRRLVVAVEVSHFGGATPGRADYEACVDRFRTFADAYRGGAVPA